MQSEAMSYEWLQIDLMHTFVLMQLFNISTMSKLQAVTIHPLIQSFHVEFGWIYTPLNGNV